MEYVIIGLLVVIFVAVGFSLRSRKDENVATTDSVVNDTPVVEEAPVSPAVTSEPVRKVRAKKTAAVTVKKAKKKSSKKV